MPCCLINLFNQFLNAVDKVSLAFAWQQLKFCLPLLFFCLRKAVLYVQHPARRQPQSPIWRDFKLLPASRLPHHCREWLLDKHSLTARLLRACGGQFAIQVISQRWGQAQLNECQLLGIAPRQRCIIREVFLLCYGLPWVYARSVLPVSSLSGELRHLRKFGNRPLGQLLFNTPNMQRSPFQLANFKLAQIPCHNELPDNAESLVWGRRSRFTIYNKPLLVSEIFLPAFRP